MTEPPAIRGIERNLARALTKAKTTLLLRYHRHRVNVLAGAPVNQVVWVDLAIGQLHTYSYNASGRLTSTIVRPGKPRGASWNANSACGCALDPFTDFGPQLHASLLGVQTIDGKRTFHLRFTGTMQAGPFMIDFWIAPSNYLPLRLKWTLRVDRGNHQLSAAMTVTDQFVWLPRTSANVARLGSG